MFSTGNRYPSVPCSRMLARKLPLQLIECVKAPGGNKIRFDHLERRFGHRVVLRTSLHARGTANLEAIQKLVYQGVVELAARVGIQHRMPKTPFHRRKSFVNQICGLVRAPAVSDDLALISRSPATDSPSGVAKAHALPAPGCLCRDWSRLI